MDGTLPPRAPQPPAELMAAAVQMRPQLHRYCTRLMRSAAEGEDVVQDTLERAFSASSVLPEAARLRPWLFRIARNRALDLLRSRAVRSAEPMEAAADVADPTAVDPLDLLMRRQALQASLVRCLGLRATQRSVVILKDVLGESLLEIAGLLGLSLDSVKAHLARGRARLRDLGDAAGAADRCTGAGELSHYVGLIEAGDWSALRSRLAGDAGRPHGLTCAASHASSAARG